MRKIYTLTIILLLSITGCINKLEPQISNGQKDSNNKSTISCIIENRDNTKSTISNKGEFFWGKEDLIGVNTDSKKNNPFIFSEQNENIVTFSGESYISIEKIEWAYYPFSVNAVIEENSLSFPLYEKRVIENFNNTPMIGFMGSDSLIHFYHTGGILNVKMIGLPDEAQHVTIKAEGSNAPFISGIAKIDDVNDPFCTYHIEEGAHEVNYSIPKTLDYLSEGETPIYSLYIPLEVGNYEKIYVQLKDPQGNILRENSISNLIVNRAQMTTMPLLNYSKGIYYYEIPKTMLTNQQADGAFILSNKSAIAYKSEEGEAGTTYSFIDLKKSNNSFESSFSIRVDSLNLPRTIMCNGNIFYLTNYSQNSFDLSVYADGKWHTLPGIQIPKEDIETKAGFEGTHTDILIACRVMLTAANFQRSIADAVEDAIKKGKDIEYAIIITKFTETLGIVQTIIENIAETNGIPTSINDMLEKLFVAHGYHALKTASDGAELIKTIIDAITGDLVAWLDLIEMGIEAYFKQIFLDQTTIEVVDASVQNLNQAKINWRVINTSTLPDIGVPTAKLLVKRYEKGSPIDNIYNRIREGGIGVSEIDNHHMYKDFNKETIYELSPEYDYYIVGCISFLGPEDRPFYRFAYYTDPIKIFMTDCIIHKIGDYINANGTSSSIKYSINVKTENVRNKDCYIGIYKDSTLRRIEYIGKKGNASTDISFDIIEDDLEIDVSSGHIWGISAKPRDQWKLGIFLENQAPQHFVEIDDDILTYGDSPVIYFSDPEIISTTLNNSNQTKANNNDTTYTTHFKFDLGIGGCFWFTSVTLSSDDGSFYKTIIAPTDNNGLYTFEGYFTYSLDKDESPFSRSINISFTLKDYLKSLNEMSLEYIAKKYLYFSGEPLDNVEILQL